MALCDASDGAFLCGYSGGHQRIQRRNHIAFVLSQGALCFIFVKLELGSYEVNVLLKHVGQAMNSVNDQCE